MNSDQRELMDGLGLAILALGVGGMLVYGAVVVALDDKLMRAGVYGVLGLGGVAAGARMVLGELARYRSRK